MFLMAFGKANLNAIVGMYYQRQECQTAWVELRQRIGGIGVFERIEILSSGIFLVETTHIGHCGLPVGGKIVFYQFVLYGAGLVGAVAVGKSFVVGTEIYP